ERQPASDQPAVTAVLEGRVRIDRRGTPGRRQPEQHAGEHRDRAGKDEYAPAHLDVELHREVHRRVPARQEPCPDAGDEVAGGAPTRATRWPPGRPGAARSIDWVSSGRTMRRRAAPIESRTASSRCRSAPRAATTLARLAQAVSSTSSASPCRPNVKARTGAP